jgi:hypothetical protein
LQAGSIDRGLLPCLAIAGVEDHVPGVGVDSRDPGDLALDPGLLERLADRRLGDGLAEVDRAAGNGPVAVVGTADQQDLACVVDLTTLTAGTRLLALGASGES